MHEREVAEAARLLADAEASRSPIPRLSHRFPGMTPSDGYAVQLRNVARRLEAGAEVKGHKIGLTSRAMQEMFGISEPDYGHLLDDMLYPTGAIAEAGRFISPKIEVELGFVLGRPIEGPGVTVDDARRAVDHGVACLEIIDSRMVDWDIGLADTIADNGSSAAAVIGETRLRLDRFDPTTVGAELVVGGEVVLRGSTADVLGNPLKVVAWLANTLAVHEMSLEPGHLVMTGSCTAAVSVEGGMRVEGRMGEFGRVEVEFC